MPRTHPPYAPAYRRRIIELARAGRKIDELAREFEPSANAISKWVKQAALDEGLRSDGLTTASARSSTACAGRTASCAKSARYFQKPRPGSLRRPPTSWLAERRKSRAQLELEAIVLRHHMTVLRRRGWAVRGSGRSIYNFGDLGGITTYA